MTQSDILSCLITSLQKVQEDLSFVSLRIWFEEGEMKFFFTNLPPRNKRQPVISTTRTPTLPPGLNSERPIENTTPILTDQPAATQTDFQTKTRGRPPRKRRCPTSSSTSPEHLRNATETVTTPANVSIISESRSPASSYSIPCTNSFQVLADLEETLDNYGGDGYEQFICQDCGENVIRTNRCKSCEITCTGCLHCGYCNE